jgi:hypothetical protein
LIYVNTKNHHFNFKQAKKAEQKTPHFLSLNQNIVAASQEEKCGLKYEILSPARKVGEFVLSLDAPSLPRLGDLR